MRSGANLGRALIATLTIVILGLSPLASLAQDSNDDNSPLYSPDSEPHGATYGQWTAEWWKWFISIPTDDNPITDQTGKMCGVKQIGPVWFLVGSGGGTADRSCTIPAGMAILIPAITGECSYAEDASLRSEADLRECAINDQDLVTQAEASLDGSNLEVHRVQSPLFDVTIPADSVIGAPEGPTQAVSDGFWVFLKPLAAGDYELHVEGVLVDPTVTGPVNLVEDSTYHLTVRSFNVFSENVTIADKSFDFPISSTSNVSNLEFDEQLKQISFSVSENITQGTMILPISWLLEGPYIIMLDGVEVTQHQTSENEETGETTLQLAYEQGEHVIIITGTSVVPEFPYSSIFIMLVVIGSIIILSRTKLIKYHKF